MPRWYQQKAPFQGLYVLGPEPDGPVKIGISATPVQRLVFLQTGSWRHLSLFYFGFFYRPEPGQIGVARVFDDMSTVARHVEHEALLVFKECDLKLHGEWVAGTVSEAVAVLRKIAGKSGIEECNCSPEEPIGSHVAWQEQVQQTEFEKVAWAAAQIRIHERCKSMKRVAPKPVA